MVIGAISVVGYVVSEKVDAQAAAVQAQTQGLQLEREEMVRAREDRERAKQLREERAEALRSKRRREKREAVRQAEASRATAAQADTSRAQADAQALRELNEIPSEAEGHEGPSSEGVDGVEYPSGPGSLELTAYIANGIDDINCGDLAASNFPTPPVDEDNLDAEGDGIACES